MIHIFTYKDGILAKLAHDLRLSIVSPTVDVDGNHVRVALSADQVRVDGVVKRGQVHPNDLSASQKQEIEKNITTKIVREHAIAFEGTYSDDALEGDLTLNGKTQSIHIPLKPEGDRLQGRADITPSKWGIAPYKAMAGAIKLQDKWTIAVDVTRP